MSEYIERRHHTTVNIMCPVCEELIELNITIKTSEQELRNDDEHRSRVITWMPGQEASNTHICQPPQNDLVADGKVVGTA